MFPKLSQVFVLAAVLVPTFAFARVWTDGTGSYSVEGDMIGVSTTTVVIQKNDKKRNLIALPISKLSQEDQDYLKSKEGADAAERAGKGQQVWTLKSGVKVSARVVEYGRRDVTIQRRRGSIFVNDRPFDNLNGIQQKVTCKIVSYFEKTKLEDKKDIEKWILAFKGEPKTYTCDGVMLELENGDEYGVPFFLFSDDDLKVMQPGWKQWLVAHQADEKAQADSEREALLLQTQTEAYQRDREADRSLRMVELGLLAVNAGMTAVWEVELYPPDGGYGRSVIVTARDSLTATQQALAQFPNCTVGPVVRVSRR
jgi:hypothetical protein